MFDENVPLYTYVRRLPTAKKGASQERASVGQLLPCQQILCLRKYIRRRLVPRDTVVWLTRRYKGRSLFLSLSLSPPNHHPILAVLSSYIC